MSHAALIAKLERGEVVIVDGGMGTEIKRRGISEGSSELSVTAMLESPDAIREVHEDFLLAGAEVIITNTYICNTRKLAHIGWISETDVEAEMAQINELAARAALDARNVAGSQNAVIAGSMGPLSQSYNPDAVLPYEECLAAYRKQANALAQAGVDVILVETCTKVHEAVAGIVAAVEAGKPAWAGFVVDEEGRVSSGERILDAQIAVKNAGASALFLNCSQAPDITAGLMRLDGHHTMPVGAYAQGAVYEGIGWDFQESMPPEQYLEHAKEWAGLGARAIGGCCGTTPEHIGALAAALAGPAT